MAGDAAAGARQVGAPVNVPLRCDRRRCAADRPCDHSGQGGAAQRRRPDRPIDYPTHGQSSSARNRE
ncbi:hypothetical protein Ga0080559_TMP739 [Salipiger profundus]|uniref:Uncharacterized protein n=1 Tax=Salipiger profundus TaxID=1229727 RepID=A0A1U7D0C5_9RHOB|nr:hypothetical protein Ga0080559_TMP739 [Salipiger profundus]